MKTWKKLLILFIFLIIIKAILTIFINTPSTFADGYIYAKTAQGIYETGTISLNGDTIFGYPPLYPLVLSITYLFKDMQITYLFMKLINVILSSLIIFPIWLLSKEFLNKKKAFLCTTIISIMPFSFAFSPFLMAENLFYPLVLFTIYFFYKAVKNNELKFFILAAIAGGLSFLTKFSALAIFAALISCLIIFLVRKQISLKNSTIFTIIFLAIMSIWFIRNGMLLGFTFEGLAGSYSREITTIKPDNVLLNFTSWIILYLGGLLLATGGYFFINSLKTIKKITKKNKESIFITICLAISVFVILIAANHNLHINSIATLLPWLTGRLIMRYVDILLPLIIILGFIGLKNKTKTKWPLNIILLITTILSTQLLFFPLFPSNNLSLTLIGVLQTIVPYLWIISIILLICLLAIWFLQNKKTIVYLLLGLFIISSIFSYAITIYNVETYWYDSEQNELGLWINENIDQDKIIMLDIDSEGKIEKLNQIYLYEKPNADLFFSILGFWVKNPTKVGSIEDEDYDYFITSKELDMEIIKETENFKIYPNPNQ
jgi:hypothetical protein